jgi:hypothetical protein
MSVASRLAEQVRRQLLKRWGKITRRPPQSRLSRVISQRERRSPEESARRIEAAQIKRELRRLRPNGSSS